MRIAIAAFALALMATPAVAVAEEAPTCAIERPVTAKLVADARDLKGVSGRADILIGNLSYMREPEAEAEAASGTVLFLKRADGWKALVPSNWENAVGLYATADGRSVIIVAQRQIEGPGQSFTVMRTRDNFATSACTELRFPEALNKPSWANEFLEPADLDITARGHGMLTASATLERSGERRRRLRYAYRTRDGGDTWSGPRHVGEAAHPPAGLYAPITPRDAAERVADLLAFAKGK